MPSGDLRATGSLLQAVGALAWMGAYVTVGGCAQPAVPSESAETGTVVGAPTPSSSGEAPPGASSADPATSAPSLVVFPPLSPEAEADFGDARPSEASGLRVSLEDPARSPDGSGFSVRFILTNTSDAAIPVFQRWNSWGAYQWRLAIRDANGQRVVAVNPQQAWTRNGPTATAIEPGGELALTALIQADPPRDARPGLDRFVSGAKVAYPLEVRGVFECARNTEPGLVIGMGSKKLAASELWVGAIASLWLTVR